MTVEDEICLVPESKRIHVPFGTHDRDSVEGQLLIAFALSSSALTLGDVIVRREGNFDGD